MIETLLFFIGFLVVLALAWGFSGYAELKIIFEAKMFNTPYYHIGISFDVYDYENGVEEEFILGLFFVNVVLVFWKPKQNINV